MTLGEKLKSIRTAKALSLEDLAQKTTLTRSFLSQIENNRTSPSVSSLIKIAQALEVRVGDLFLEERDWESCIIHKNQRESYVIEKNKLWFELLAPRGKDIKIEASLVHFGIEGMTETISSGGVFIALILQGKVELKVNEKTHILTEGDSIYLDNPPEHSWRNSGETEVIAVTVSIPQ